MIFRNFLAVISMLFIVGGYNLENDTSAASDFDASIRPRISLATIRRLLFREMK